MIFYTFVRRRIQYLHTELVPRGQYKKKKIQNQDDLLSSSPLQLPIWGAIEDPPIYFNIFLPVAFLMLLAGQDTMGLTSAQVLYILPVLVSFGAKAGTSKHSATLGAEGKQNMKRIY